MILFIFFMFKNATASKYNIFKNYFSLSILSISEVIDKL
jgi:hypothetical protein